jgi:hypothetical protein
MSNVRFALGFPRHRKVKRLSNDAFALWVTAMHHARDQGTDGFLDDAELDDVPRCPPRGAKRKALVAEIVTAKLWDDVDGGGWQIHDYTDWQDSAEQVKVQRDAACKRARTYRARKAARLAELTAIVTRDGVHDVQLDISTSSSDSGSESGEGDARGSPEDDERSTVCPLDLEQKAENLGVTAELCDQLKADFASVQHGIREFVSYWTVGDGRFKKRSAWMRKLREDIRHKALDGRLKPPGAIEHDARNSRGGPGPVAPSKYAAEALQMVAERGRE